MTNYVLGFMFCQEHVLLIQKTRPEWQAGKLNGVGGHLEAGERPYNAMVREFEEEAGVEHHDWALFAQLCGKWGNVYCYRTFVDVRPDIKSMTDENVGWYWTGNNDLVSVTVPNLKWMLPFAYQAKFIGAPVQVWEDQE